MSVDSKLLKSGKPKSKPTMADVAGERIKSPRRKRYTPAMDREKTMKKGRYKNLNQLNTMPKKGYAGIISATTEKVIEYLRKQKDLGVKNPTIPKRAKGGSITKKK
tara:strand:+ start:587 stop:904 length:318 start_codon:yes stop_codon:yes gene_type:complete